MNGSGASSGTRRRDTYARWTLTWATLSGNTGRVAAPIITKLSRFLYFAATRSRIWRAFGSLCAQPQAQKRNAGRRRILSSRPYCRPQGSETAESRHDNGVTVEVDSGLARRRHFTGNPTFEEVAEARCLR